MERLRRAWLRIPTRIRKPIVLAIGLLFIALAGLTGWLPGPGGIPLFLLGIAILATEFSWAKQIQDYILHLVKLAGAWMRRHLIWSIIIIGVLVIELLTGSWLLFQRFHS